jgi:hypothetical protein
VPRFARAARGGRDDSVRTVEAGAAIAVPIDFRDLPARVREIRGERREAFSEVADFARGAAGRERDRGEARRSEVVEEDVFDRRDDVEVGEAVPVPRDPLEEDDGTFVDDTGRGGDVEEARAGVVVEAARPVGRDDEEIGQAVPLEVRPRDGARRGETGETLARGDVLERVAAVLEEAVLAQGSAHVDVRLPVAIEVAPEIGGAQEPLRSGGHAGRSAGAGAGSGTAIGMRSEAAAGSCEASRRARAARAIMGLPFSGGSVVGTGARGERSPRLAGNAQFGGRGPLRPRFGSKRVTWKPLATRTVHAGPTTRPMVRSLPPARRRRGVGARLRRDGPRALPRRGAPRARPARRRGPRPSDVPHRDRGARDVRRARELLPWLLGILARKAAEERRRARRSIEPDRLEAREAEDPARGIESLEVSVAVASAIERTPAPYREVLEAHLKDGKSAQEIALALGRAPGTVRVQIHRGLEMVRRALPAGLAVGGLIGLAPRGLGWSGVPSWARLAARPPRSPRARRPRVGSEESR